MGAGQEDSQGGPWERRLPLPAHRPAAWLSSSPGVLSPPTEPGNIFPSPSFHLTSRGALRVGQGVPAVVPTSHLGAHGFWGHESLLPPAPPSAVLWDPALSGASGWGRKRRATGGAGSRAFGPHEPCLSLGVQGRVCPGSPRTENQSSRPVLTDSWGRPRRVWGPQGPSSPIPAAGGPGRQGGREEAGAGSRRCLSAFCRPPALGCLPSLRVPETPPQPPHSGPSFSTAP